MARCGRLLAHILSHFVVALAFGKRSGSGGVYPVLDITWLPLSHITPPSAVVCASTKAADGSGSHDELHVGSAVQVNYGGKPGGKWVNGSLVGVHAVH